MSARGRQYAESVWDREQISRQWEDLLRGLAKV